ncbi:fungal-specific transcription factor domain-containing protein [Aspergillus pseudoustus]|uniref:Fungal-specific transcription factor domain-containing protein n=1 Tax=Aspergillus pseudoustus TaxID=1810923 RepID=A0ABR4K268_9EURO
MSTRRIQRVHGPYQRAARACINCRRKKARCPGETPECSTCVRLHQECSYSASNDQTTTKITNRHTNLSTEQTAARLDKLEQYLRHIDEKLERLLPNPEGYNSHTKTWDSSITGIETPTSSRDPLLSLLSLPKPSAQMHLLPAYDEQLILVDCYFSYFHSQPYSLFHESDFRIRFHTGNVPDHLLLAVMVNALRFVDNSTGIEERLQTAATFADSAWQAINKDCFSGKGVVDLPVIQTLILLCIFDVTAGNRRHNSAWVKIGIAVRLAQDSRLTEEAEVPLSLSEKEERRRVFWSLYLLERLLSCGRCRPPAILDLTCSLQLPSDEDNYYANMEEPTPTLLAIYTNSTGQSPRLSASGAVIVTASLLSQCAQYMLHKQHISHGNVPWHPQSQHSALVPRMMQLEAQLGTSEPLEDVLRARCYEPGIVDQSISGPLVFSRLLFYLCQCLAWHPFLLREQMFVAQILPPKLFWNQVKEMSLNASNDMLDLIHRAKQAGCMLISSFSGYCATVAATIQALHYSSRTPREDVCSETWYQHCSHHLRWLSGYWQNSVTMVSNLENLCKNIGKYSDVLSGDPCRSRLDAHDRDLMWSLLDYSTISKENTRDFYKN